MIYLFKAAFPTLGVMCYEILINKTKNNPLLYIALFITLVVANYFLATDLHARAPFDYQCALTEKQRDYFFLKIHAHYMKASILSTKANACIEILKNNLSENEYHLSNATIVAISTGAFTKNLSATGVAAAITLLEGLLQDFKHAWAEIQTCLIKVEYHIEMAEFYENVLIRDGE